MRDATKYTLIYVGVLFVLIFMAVSLAQAQQTDTVIEVEAVDAIQSLSDLENTAVDKIQLDPAELDQMLAPIALYPDSLLSHILVASTYPLEIVQAARWREQHSDLDENEALEAVEEETWDPSVKALVPFNELLEKLSDDLAWLQQLGDAFLANEEQVLSSVQTLRQKAYEHGSLNNNEYIEVVEEDDNISIQPVEKEIVYVPYYDTRSVYGSWWWNSHQPVYWHRPSHYYWHAGFYWSPRFYVRPSYFLGGFHWSRRHLVVDRYYYNHRRRYDDGHRRVRVTEYQRWNHNPEHRRGVRYNNNGKKSIYHHNKMRPVQVVRSNEGYSKNKVKQINAYGRETNRRQVSTVSKTRKQLNKQGYRNENKSQKVRTREIVREQQARNNKVKNFSQDKVRPIPQQTQKVKRYNQTKSNTSKRNDNRDYSASRQSNTNSKSKSYSRPSKQSGNKTYSRPSNRKSSNQQRSVSRSSQRSVSRSSGQSSKSSRNRNSASRQKQR